jgi:ribosomal protein S12 methylthiotransferase
MEIQQGIAFDWCRRQVGQDREVIIDGADPEVPNHFRGRGYADAPEIDAMIRVKAKSLHSGDIVRVKVTAADGYDLVGRAIGQGR